MTDENMIAIIRNNAKKIINIELQEKKEYDDKLSFEADYHEQKIMKLLCNENNLKTASQDWVILSYREYSNCKFTLDVANILASRWFILNACIKIGCESVYKLFRSCKFYIKIRTNKNKFKEMIQNLAIDTDQPMVPVSNTLIGTSTNTSEPESIEGQA